MVVVDILGVSVDFPFEPYQIQKDYMEKVVECLQNECVGVLESPTGTGKTLSLLCASLAWLQLKKAQLQAQQVNFGLMPGENKDFLDELDVELSKAGKIPNGRAFMGLPTIIYASRTHSQLSQAMQELKRSKYSYMKATVLGSRDQLCIHPDILREEDRSLRIQLCHQKTESRSCHFNNRVDLLKDSQEIAEQQVIDIEDIVKLGEKHRFCPYYMTKELQKRADIIFAPYNYLLDPLARKALGLDLTNKVVILDEAHNVEKVCEESASFELKSTDIAVAIDECTAVMKIFEKGDTMNFDESPRDFDENDLMQLKQIFVDFESVLDAIPLNTNLPEGTNFHGDFIYEILGKAQINSTNSSNVIRVIDRVTNFLSTNNNGPFARKGKAMKLFGDFLSVVFFRSKLEFNDFKAKVKRCYKVHVRIEEEKRNPRKSATTWLSKEGKKTSCRILSYWCFSPGFGMNMIMDQNVRSLILTSGTLAPLKPLISELDLNVQVRLENPHIVGPSQICVKILPAGPDGEVLNCNYQNRDNVKYLNSLGLSIVNICRMTPGGMLIFFPSYPVMDRCINEWKEGHIWSQLMNFKPVYVEPREKNAFKNAMINYYETINANTAKGAIFMGVCRGKVSEGLDFVDANGRAVIITGLPYPPLKDPKVILKKRYLDLCHSKNKEYLTGQDWYSLEATRAVNQAIGRVIRHRFDYGAILLLDQRFCNPKVKEELSRWLRDHIKVVKFGELVRDLKKFFDSAAIAMPQLIKQNSINLAASSSTQVSDSSAFQSSILNYPSTNSLDSVETVKSSSSVIEISSESSSEDLQNGLVSIHKRRNDGPLINLNKKKKIHVVQRACAVKSGENDRDYLALVKSQLGDNFGCFMSAIKTYKDKENFEEFTETLDHLCKTGTHIGVFLGLEKYIRPYHSLFFSAYLDKKS